MATINLNDWVAVKLTDYGKDIYYHQYDGLLKEHPQIKTIKPKYPEVDENGYTRFQLWQFIELYGPYIGMGEPNVIEPLNIEVI